MRVAIVGAGVVGVTTAYALARRGHAVTLYDCNGRVGEGASFAPGGLLTAAPGSPWGDASGPLGLGWRDLVAAPGWIGWSWRRWRAHRSTQRPQQLKALQALARNSRDHTLALARELNLSFQQTPGHLVLLRSEREWDQAQIALQMLQEAEVGHAVVDAAACRRIEPALQSSTALQAGIHLPMDGVGSCRQFAQRLMAHAEQLGTRLRSRLTVTAVEGGQPPRLQLADGQAEPTDAIVLCTGAQDAGLLHKAGIRLPLRAVHGLSLTAPLRPTEGHHEGPLDPAPRTIVTDARERISIGRLGPRLRVAGWMQAGQASATGAGERALYRVLRDWFPGAARVDQAQVWCGARPSLPDGLPVIGASGQAGIWLNLGHGAHGWTLACGAATLLAAQMTGEPAELDASPFSLDRHG